ncbi:MAG TPA: hypothetical protein VGE52_03850, partial [Pirellulales bacterium]
VAIAVSAADAFCDARPRFEAPQGSPRRQKGYRDARLMIRYFVASIREGSFAPLRDKVLAWYVGHLDEEIVSGDDIEVFLRFIGQAAEAKLAPPAWPYFQELIEAAVALCRNAGVSGALRAKHRRIADSAVRRLLQVSPEFEQRHGAASLSKGKRDMEIFVQEFSKMLHSPSLDEIQIRVSSWLLEKLVPFVEGSADTWHWMFVSLREAVVERCGPAAGRRVGAVLNRIAENAERLVNAASAYRVAGAIGELGAELALQVVESPGFDVENDFKPRLAQANRQLVCSLLTLYACGGFEQFPERLVEIWRREYQPELPVRTPDMQISALQSLLAAAQQKAPGLGVQVLQAGLGALAKAAKRCAAAHRLGALSADAIDQTTIWAATQLPVFANASPTVRRELTLDLRLCLSYALQLVALGPGEPQTVAMRMWTARFLASTWGQWSWDGGNELLQALARSYSQAASPADYALLQPWFEEALKQLADSRRVQPLGGHFAAAGEAASQAFYQRHADHPTAATGGPAAAARDGRLLLDQMKQTLALGPGAELRLHAWFQDEIVGRSRLPGKLVNEFLDALKDEVRDPNLAKLLAGLRARASSYTAAWALEREAESIAREATPRIMARLPEYAAKVGELGAASAGRDNATTLRRVALCLLQPRDASAEMQTWWQQSVGRYIATRPKDLFKVNLEELKTGVMERLDSTEHPPALMLLSAAYRGLV